MIMKYPQPTTIKDKVPLLFHEPHVVTGFRPVHQPWSSYFLSIFQWHNEVMNVWTHLLALFIVIIRAWSWSKEFDLIRDPYMWPLSVGIVTMIVLYICSSFAHCFQNRSELVHYTCFMIDYVGIGLYGFGSTMLHYWYCLHEDFLGSLSHQLAIPVGAFLAVLVCTCCSISKTKYTRPYPFTRRLWQISSVLSIYVWLIFPIWYKILLYMYDGNWESSFSHHLQQMFWFTSGGFFFGSDIPQRFFPGCFDLIGHSHQLFHVCILMTTFEQMNALYLEITDGVDFIRNMEAPTFLNTWGMLIFVILANSMVVLLFHMSVRKRLQMQSIEEEGKEKVWTEMGSGVASKPEFQNGKSGATNFIRSHYECVGGGTTDIRQRNGSIDQSKNNGVS